MRGSKSCSKCREVKPLDEFYYHKHSAKLYPACRRCHTDLVIRGQRRKKLPKSAVADFIHDLLTRHLEVE